MCKYFSYINGQSKSWCVCLFVCLFDWLFDCLFVCLFVLMFVFSICMFLYLWFVVVVNLWRGLITLPKITSLKVIKLIKNMVVDHFVDSTSGVLAHYLWRIIYGYQGMWGVRWGKVRLGKVSLGQARSG